MGFCFIYPTPHGGQIDQWERGDLISLLVVGRKTRTESENACIRPPTPITITNIRWTCFGCRKQGGSGPSHWSEGRQWKEKGWAHSFFLFFFSFPLSLRNTSPSSYNWPKRISSLAILVTIHSLKGRGRWEGEISVDFYVALFGKREVLASIKTWQRAQ